MSNVLSKFLRYVQIDTPSAEDNASSTPSTPCQLDLARELFKELEDMGLAAKMTEHGYVYAAVPPLFKLTRGKTVRLAFDDAERERIAAEMRQDNPNAKVEINRFKGLGEMDPHELWETTMNPETRILKRIELDDAVRADEIFTILMGEKVEPRKEFIEKNAKSAVNLDF